MKVEVNGCRDEQRPDKKNKVSGLVQKKKVSGLVQKKKVSGLVQKKKVSGLVHVLYKVTIQREFANSLHL
jgi:hypothetical protein